MSEVRKPNVTDQGKIGITHKFVSSVYIDHTILNTSRVSGVAQLSATDLRYLPRLVGCQFFQQIMHNMNINYSGRYISATLTEGNPHFVDFFLTTG